MFLHENKVLFSECISGITSSFGYCGSIIEKDYYVFLLLKYIVFRLGDGVVFKGGTSLSKAYNLINRFSEDIDLCLQKDKIKSKGARKRIVESVFDGFKELNLQDATTRVVQRQGDYNDLRGVYIPVTFDRSVDPYVKVEVAHRIREFPYEKRQVSSYIGDYLYRQYGSYGNYGLEPFHVLTVSFYRTFVDKLFAIGDYYLSGKITRYSRHLYDVYKLSSVINWADIGLIYDLRSLMSDVNLERRLYGMCKSSQNGVSLKDVLYNAMTSDYYKDDYNNITMRILYETVPYEACKSTILKLLGTSLFD